MSDSMITEWRGRRIEELTREELIECIHQLGGYIRIRQVMSDTERELRKVIDVKRRHY